MKAGFISFILMGFILSNCKGPSCQMENGTDLTVCFEYTSLTMADQNTAKVACQAANGKWSEDPCSSYQHYCSGATRSGLNIDGSFAVGSSYDYYISDNTAGADIFTFPNYKKLCEQTETGVWNKSGN